MYQGYEQLPALEGRDPSRRGEGPVIRAAHPTEGDRLTATVVAGYGPTPLCEWLAPTGGFRRGVLTGYFRILVTHLVLHGHVELVDGDRLPSAVAGWLPANAPTAPPDYAGQLARATGPWVERFQTLDDQVARVHAHGHRRLVFLAVLPTVQGQGLGSALLGHHLRGLDERGICASVEAVGPRSVALYRRCGFTPHGKPIATTVGAEWVLTPMRRPPQPPVGLTTATVPRAHPERCDPPRVKES